MKFHQLQPARRNSLIVTFHSRYQRRGTSQNSSFKEHLYIVLLVCKIKAQYAVAARWKAYSPSRPFQGHPPLECPVQAVPDFLKAPESDALGAGGPGGIPGTYSALQG